MAQLTLFPLQFKRQDATPVDIDTVFATTAERMTYLTSPRRHAGQIVADIELNKAFMLNDARNAWLPIGSSELVVRDEGTQLTPAATSLNFVGDGVTASVSGSAVTITVPGAASSDLVVRDEGTQLTPAATSLNFVGDGVTASVSGTAVTITVPGGGSGGGDSLWKEERYDEVPEETGIIFQDFTVAKGAPTLSGQAAEVGFPGLLWEGTSGYSGTENFALDGIWAGNDNSTAYRANIGIGQADAGIGAGVTEFDVKFKLRVPAEQAFNESGVRIEYLFNGEYFNHRIWTLDGEFNIYSVDPAPANIVAYEQAGEYEVIISIRVGEVTFSILKDDQEFHNTQSFTLPSATAAGFERISLQATAGYYFSDFIISRVISGGAGGVTVDSIQPDPTTPAPVVEGFTRVDAVVLPDHELHVQSNDFVVSEGAVAVQFQRYAFTSQVPQAAIFELNVNPQGLSYYYQLNGSGAGSDQELMTGILFRRRYEEMYDATTPLRHQIQRNVSGTNVGTGPQVYDTRVIPGHEDRMFFTGRFGVTDDAPTWIIGTTQTNNSEPVSATNDFAFMGWALSPVAGDDWLKVSNTICLLPDGKAVFAARTNTLAYLYCYDYQAQLVWQTQLDLEEIGPGDSHFKLSGHPVTIGGTSSVVIMVENAVFSVDAATGQNVGMRVVMSIPANCQGISDNRGWSYVGGDGFGNLVVGGMFDFDGTGGLSGTAFAVTRVTPSRTHLDTKFVGWRASSDENAWLILDAVSFNGELIVANDVNDRQRILLARVLFPSGTSGSMVVDKTAVMTASESDGDPLSLVARGYQYHNLTSVAGVFDPAHPTEALHFGLTGYDPSGNQRIVWDIEILDWAAAVGKQSNDTVHEWDFNVSPYDSLMEDVVTVINVINDPSTSQPGSVNGFSNLSVVRYEGPEADTPEMLRTTFEIIGAPGSGGSGNTRPALKVKNSAEVGTLRVAKHDRVIPTSSRGQAGDKKGDIAWGVGATAGDAGKRFVYVCHQNYNADAPDTIIWTRVETIPFGMGSGPDPEPEPQPGLLRVTVTTDSTNTAQGIPVMCKISDTQSLIVYQRTSTFDLAAFIMTEAGADVTFSDPVVIYGDTALPWSVRPLGDGSGDYVAFFRTITQIGAIVINITDTVNTPYAPGLIAVDTPTRGYGEMMGSAGQGGIVYERGSSVWTWGVAVKVAGPGGDPVPEEVIDPGPPTENGGDPISFTTVLNDQFTNGSSTPITSRAPSDAGGDWGAWTSSTGITVNAGRAGPNGTATFDEVRTATYEPSVFVVLGDPTTININFRTPSSMPGGEYGGIIVALLVNNRRFSANLFSDGVSWMASARWDGTGGSFFEELTESVSLTANTNYTMTMVVNDTSVVVSITGGAFPTQTCATPSFSGGRFFTSLQMTVGHGFSVDYITFDSPGSLREDPGAVTYLNDTDETFINTAIYGDNFNGAAGTVGTASGYVPDLRPGGGTYSTVTPSTIKKNGNGFLIYDGTAGVQNGAALAFNPQNTMYLNDPYKCLLRFRTLDTTDPDAAGWYGTGLKLIVGNNSYTAYIVADPGAGFVMRLSATNGSDTNTATDVPIAMDPNSDYCIELTARMDGADAVFNNNDVDYGATVSLATANSTQVTRIEGRLGNGFMLRSIQARRPALSVSDPRKIFFGEPVQTELSSLGGGGSRPVLYGEDSFIMYGSKTVSSADYLAAAEFQFTGLTLAVSSAFYPSTTGSRIRSTPSGGWIGYGSGNSFDFGGGSVAKLYHDYRSASQVNSVYGTWDSGTHQATYSNSDDSPTDPTVNPNQPTEAFAPVPANGVQGYGVVNPDASGYATGMYTQTGNLMMYSIKKETDNKIYMAGDHVMLAEATTATRPGHVYLTPTKIMYVYVKSAGNYIGGGIVEIGPEV